MPTDILACICQKSIYGKFRNSLDVQYQSLFIVHIFEAYKNILYNNVKENRKFTTLGKLTVSILRITYTYVRISFISKLLMLLKWLIA